MKNKILKILSIAVVFSVLMPRSVMGNTAAPPEITVLESNITVAEISNQSTLDFDASHHTSDGRVSLIIELQQPPLGLAVQSQNTKLNISSSVSQNYLVNLALQQDRVISEIAALAPSMDVGFQYQTAFNGFSVLMDPEEASALLKVDSVKHVYPDRRRSLLLNSSTEVVNAPAFWTELSGQANAGAGVRIAVIDTGIRSENPMFEDTGNFTQLPGFPKGYCAPPSADPDFQCNAKLIVARYYEPLFNIHADEVLSPLDIHGHGSHVAGIAAGNPVIVPEGAVVPEATAISGVAPGAYLMVYKALFVEPDGGVTGTDSMFLAAIEDAFLDGADVINNSWGESENTDPADSPYQTVVASLKAAGIVVVFAAGNGGPDQESISCPGCLEDVITVGATTADRIYANTLDLIWPDTPDNPMGLAALTGTGPEITDDIDAEIIYAGTVDPSNFDGCASFGPGVFSNSIALIQRGSCVFLDKVNHAWAAGAVAVVVFNDEPGFPVRMNNLQTTQIPAVLMSKDQGEAVRDWIAGKTSPMARINADKIAVRNSYWQDALWESSSVGPNGNPNILKPDIVAPGFFILSASSPVFSGGQDFQFFRGTSMAAPHISGAAALMLQKYPTWTPQQIKSVLTSTANQFVTQSDGSTQATPFMRGSGRLDLAAARNAGLTFSHSSFVNSQCSTQCSWRVNVKNETSDNNTWWDAVVEAPPGVDVQVEPSYLILGLGETRTFTVTADVSAVPVDQWYFGNIRWQQITDTHSPANLPLAVFATEQDQASLDKTAHRSFAEPGDTVDYSISLINDSPLTTTFTISDVIPANASYVPGSVTGGLIYDDVSNALTGTVQLSGVKMHLIPDTLYGYFSLSDYADPAPCPNLDCDEGTSNLTGLDFIYNGRRFSDLMWSANGFVQVGDADTYLSEPNQNLPDSVAPNNILAPLWTDLEIDTCSTGGEKMGWYFGSATDGDFVYDIVEWKEAALKNDPTACYSFQIWIKRGTDQIWYVYGPQTAPLTVGTVGLENQYGSAGYSRFYNGSGIAPTEGTTLKAINSVDEASFTYSLEMGSALGVDVINTVQIINSGTGQVFQDFATVQIGRQIYLPLLIR